DDLIAKTSAYLPRKADKGRIGKAYVYSAQLHRDSFLRSHAPARTYYSGGRAMGHQAAPRSRAERSRQGRTER
ncbi:MAG: hypothetical protein O7A67_08200, partial [SAR324 cluster bacterium]|nr:hypothetical protein [SAR324 cluster bacterium]